MIKNITGPFFSKSLYPHHIVKDYNSWNKVYNVQNVNL